MLKELCRISVLEAEGMAYNYILYVCFQDEPIELIYKIIRDRDNSEVFYSDNEETTKRVMQYIETVVADKNSMTFFENK